MGQFLEWLGQQGTQQQVPGFSGYRVLVFDLGKNRCTTPRPRDWNPTVTAVANILSCMTPTREVHQRPKSHLSWRWDNRPLQILQPDRSPIWLPFRIGDQAPFQHFCVQWPRVSIGCYTIIWWHGHFSLHHLQKLSLWENKEKKGATLLGNGVAVLQLSKESQACLWVDSTLVRYIVVTRWAGVKTLCSINIAGSMSSMFILPFRCPIIRYWPITISYKIYRYHNISSSLITANPKKYIYISHMIPHVLLQETPMAIPNSFVQHLLNASASHWVDQASLRLLLQGHVVPSTT